MTKVEQIPVGGLHIDPMNVRSAPQVTKEFIQSVKSSGILQPLIVRPVEDGYGVVVGGRRYAAAVKGGLEEVPCEIRELSDDEAREISLVENWMRENLTKGDSEKAVYEAYVAGLESGVYASQRGMAEKTGISQSVISKIVQRVEDSKEMSIDTQADAELSYQDYDRTRSLKDKRELRKQLLEKRAEDKVRAEDLRKISKTLKGSSEKARERILSKEMISPKKAKSLSIMYAEEEKDVDVRVDLADMGISHDFSPQLSRKIVRFASDIGKQPEEAVNILVKEALEGRGYGS